MRCQAGNRRPPDSQQGCGLTRGRDGTRADKGKIESRTLPRPLYYAKKIRIWLAGLLLTVSVLALLFFVIIRQGDRWHVETYSTVYSFLVAPSDAIYELHHGGWPTHSARHSVAIHLGLDIRDGVYPLRIEDISLSWDQAQPLQPFLHKSATSVFENWADRGVSLDSIELVRLGPPREDEMYRQIAKRFVLRAIAETNGQVGGRVDELKRINVDQSLARLAREISPTLRLWILLLAIALCISAIGTILIPPLSRKNVCARCGYSLLGISAARCPECGEKYTHDALPKDRVIPDNE